jgi:uncharacterized membrane protein
LPWSAHGQGEKLLSDISSHELSGALTAPHPPRSDGPAWEFLISHHLPSRFNRTIAIRWRSRTYHFCARCSGQLLGVFAWLGTFGILDAAHFSIFDFRIQLLFALFPLPAAVDWVTQASGHRESRNLLRLLSGVLLGVTFTDWVASLVLAQWTLLIAGLVVFLLYVGGLMAALRLSGAWRKVISEHFPGITLE